MPWTPEQERAIGERGHNLLINAAAGSGKTAVLTERVVSYIEQGGSFDHLLIVTFTRLAAGEMRERIAKSLHDRCKENPSAHMQRQSLLVYQAKICTIDSYYNDLLRNHFQLLGLSPDFGMMDDVEYDFLREKILQDVLDGCYRDYHNGFDRFERFFGGESNDQGIFGLIKNLYAFMQAIPFGNRWATLQISHYDNPQIWIDAACAELLIPVKEWCEIYREILDSEVFASKENDVATITSEYDFLISLRHALEARNWTDVLRACRFIFDDSPTCKAGIYMMQKYKDVRNRVKEFLKNNLFCMCEADIRHDLTELKSGIEALFAVTEEFRAALMAECMRRNRFPFDLLSQMALSLVVADYRPEDGTFVRTPLAEQICSQYKEVLIDEYQDVNGVQDLFFSAITSNTCFSVGDVKQSIYGFRRANPNHFLHKRTVYDVIHLNRNFRSKPGILHFVNFVCGQLFSEEVGGLVYDENEALYPGRTDVDETPAVELHLLQTGYHDGIPKTSVQAEYAARKILHMIETEYIRDKESGQMRPLRFGDIAILLRTVKNVSPVYEEIFLRYGIPVAAVSGDSYFNATEVQTVLAMLTVIDNPYRDLQLYAVMTSPLYGFTAEEMAQIRLEGKYCPLIEAVRRKKSEKTRKFLDALAHFTLIAQSLPIHKLVWAIYTETQYPAMVSCLPMGSLRHKNLMKFYSFACTYSERYQLYGFLRFAEKAALERDSAPASVGNFVRVMTIHASKGLEFPVCILADLQHDSKNDDLFLYMDEQLGIGVKMRDEEMTSETTTFMREVLKMRKKRTEVSESLRLLYVALTRPREKLILLGADYYAKRLETQAFFANGERLYSHSVLNMRRFLDLILATCSRHPDAAELQTDFSDIRGGNGRIAVFAPDANAVLDGTEEVGHLEQAIHASVTVEELRRRFQPQTLRVSSEIPAKISVTELVKRASTEGGAELILPQISFEKPRFLEAQPLTAAERGTAMHEFCRYADFSVDPEREAERLVSKGFLSENQANVLQFDRLRAFCAGPIPSLLASADRILREEQFVVRIPATEVRADADENETVLLQGAIDLLCEYGEELVIVDFKTDRLQRDALIERYALQLRYYAMAAEKCFGKSVRKALLWSFHLSEMIEIPMKNP